jgi:DNA modification methylase
VPLKTKKMKTQKVQIETIKLDPSNPRSITKEAFESLKQSITDFPEMQSVKPLVVADGYAIAGNMRLLAYKDLGYRELHVLDVSEWSQAKRDEFMIKDNTHYGSWDYDALANEWDTLPLTEWGVAVWDTDVEDVKGLTDEDDVPEAPQEPITKLGDVWILGEHRVMCGDSTSKEAVEILMDGEKATLIHADPPYGMGKEKDGVLNDNLYREKLDAFQMAWWKAFRPFAEDNASAYIWGNAPDLWRLWYRGGLEDSERLTFRNDILWEQEGVSWGKDGMSNLRQYATMGEHCLFFMMGEQGFNNNTDNYWEGFESIRSWLVSEKEKSGLSNKKIKEITNTSHTHYWTKSQWAFPTEEHYNSIKKAAEKEAFAKEYDILKKEFYSTRAYFNSGHDKMRDVWRFDRVKGEERHGHATPKPVEMMERVMKSSAPENAIVVEPFLGSGSTLIASEKTNRKCYGMELDPKYCDVIVKRWEDFTGKKAHLEENEFEVITQAH